VWTQDGYEVGCEPSDYPLFLAAREQDVDAWEAFFETIDLLPVCESRVGTRLGIPKAIVLSHNH